MLLVRRSDEPGSETIWCKQRLACEPFPDLLERLFGRGWLGQMPPEQAERSFGAEPLAGSPISA